MSTRTWRRCVSCAASCDRNPALRVIEADVLPLAELAADKAQGAAGGRPPSSRTGVERRLRRHCRRRAATAAPAPQAPAAPRRQDRPTADKIRNEKDLEKYQTIFANVAFWKKLGEEYQNPLIVTGTVLFTPQQTAGFVTPQPRESTTSSAAAASSRTASTWSARASSSAEVHLHRRPDRHDAATTESFHEESSTARSRTRRRCRRTSS